MLYGALLLFLYSLCLFLCCDSGSQSMLSVRTRALVGRSKKYGWKTDEDCDESCLGGSGSHSMRNAGDAAGESSGLEVRGETVADRLLLRGGRGVKADVAVTLGEREQRTD